MHLKALSHELPLCKAEPPLHYKAVSIHTENHSNINKHVGTMRLTLDGPTPPAYNLACNRMAISWRTCEMYLRSNQSKYLSKICGVKRMAYCLSVSASWRSRGGSYAWFRGNETSPGIANCSSETLIRAWRDNAKDISPLVPSKGIQHRRSIEQSTNSFHIPFPPHEPTLSV